MNLQERAYRNGKYTFRLALERAKRYNAFPSWADTPEERKAMLQIYIHAQYKNLTTKKKWQVDHIIPLYGLNICGLHVASNLRVVSKVANQHKSNTFHPYIEKKGKRKRVEGFLTLPTIPWKPKRKGRPNPTNKSLQRMAAKVIFRKRNF